MKITEPHIFLIGESRVNEDELSNFLSHIGVPQWTTDAPSDIEKITEVMGRGCYESFGTELNKNITRVREGNERYLENIISSRHGSVLEHTMLNFMICDVSRVFTHELITHRVGTAKSQESLRFVRKNELSFWMPEDMEIISSQTGHLSIKQVQDAKSLIFETAQYLEGQMNRLSEIFDLDNISSFEIKKRLTTIIRRIAPEGGLTNIGWSCNVRTLRHLLESRTSPHAEEEIRNVFSSIGFKVMDKYTNLFRDYKTEMVNGYASFSTLHTKV